MHSGIYLQKHFDLQKKVLFTAGIRKGRFESPEACLLTRIARSVGAKIFNERIGKKFNGYQYFRLLLPDGEF